MRATAALLAMLALTAHGQSAPQPHFDAATVKLGGDKFSTIPERSPGRFRWVTQIAYLAGYAYNLDFSRVSGPGLGAIYEISAVFDSSASDDQVRLMLQSLLAERFKMRVHRVTTEADGYAITVARGGAKLKESSVADNPPGNPVFATSPAKDVIAVTGRKASMSQLATLLGRVTRTPTWDQTGLSGSYDFAFRFSQDLSPDSPNDAPSLATALRDLGLTLQKQKGPVESLVIDSIQPPGDN